jgi:site-specific recombinase XerD
MKLKQPKVSEVKSVKNGTTYTLWQVAWTDADGKRQRRQFADKAAARLYASEQHTQQLNQGSAYRTLATTLPEPKLREAEACFSLLGDKYRLTECVDYFLQHHKSADFKITIQDALFNFLKAREGEARDVSLVKIRQNVKRFQALTNNCFVHEVTTGMVQSFMQSLRAKDGVNQASLDTRNNYRTLLHLFFQWCCDRPQEYISFNPVSDIALKNIDRGEPEILSIQECEELMRFVEAFKGGKYVKYFSLALFAGIRPDGELQSLPDAAIKLENSIIKIPSDVSKNRDTRTVTIQPNLAQWLAKYPGEIVPMNFDNETAEIRKRFGLARDVLRKTFISMHVMAFDSFAKTALEAGNSEKVIRDHYFGLASKADAQRFWNIVPVTESNIVPFAQAV